MKRAACSVPARIDDSHVYEDVEVMRNVDEKSR